MCAMYHEPSATRRPRLRLTSPSRSRPGRTRHGVVYDDGILHIVWAPGIRGYTLTGEVDASTYDGLAAALHDLGDEGDVYLDLHGLIFCDAAGLGVMVSLTGQVGRDHRVVLDGVTRTLAKLLTIVGWDALPNLEVHPRPSDADGDSAARSG